MVELNLNDILIVEDALGNRHTDIVQKVSRYTFCNNSLCSICGQNFYLDYYNDFEKITIDIACDLSAHNSISQYKLLEIWVQDGLVLKKVYSNYTK